MYILTQSAKKDVKGIWNYTADKWGVEQADRYHRQLESHFLAIACRELLGRQVPDTDENTWSVRCDHYIFFLPGERTVILAVLHEKMNLIARLRERLG